VPPATEGLVTVRRALLSVDDPTGVGAFAAGLAALHIDLLATSGTRRRLADAGVSARGTETLTGVDAWFGGRVKTLHPALLGGILAPRTPEGERELSERKLEPIDLVVVNFYPFEARRVEAPDRPDLAEHIDVGGVTLARAAAKNFAHVAVVTDPAQYDGVLAELTAHQGALTAATRRTLALAAFDRTAAYDAAIASGLEPDPDPRRFPRLVVLAREPIRLRYGENPHQAAAAYRFARSPGGPDVPTVESLKGDSLSFTNLLDLETALGAVAEFDAPAAAVVKHATPVGVAVAGSAGEALTQAIATDPVARYGCVVAVNRPFEAADAARFHGVFVDVLAAPTFGAGTLDALERRHRLKVVRVAAGAGRGAPWDAHSAVDRVLLQEADRRPLPLEEMRPVTGSRPTDAELLSLQFAWQVVRHAKSNAVVLATGAATVGIGSGQPTRVKAVELALEVAGDRARGSVLASDAFFPFADGIEAAGRAGVRAIVQPGGSVRDAEVVAAAERFGIAMVVTGWRVFRH